MQEEKDNIPLVKVDYSKAAHSPLPDTSYKNRSHRPGDSVTILVSPNLCDAVLCELQCTFHNVLEEQGMTVDQFELPDALITAVR